MKAKKASVHSQITIMVCSQEYRFSRNVTVREEMKEKDAAKSPATETGGTASKAESETSSGKAFAGGLGESTESEEDSESDTSVKASEEAVPKTGLNASGEEKAVEKTYADTSDAAVPEGSVSRFLRSAGTGYETVSVQAKSAAATSGKVEIKDAEKASSGETAEAAAEEQLLPEHARYPGCRYGAHARNRDSLCGRDYSEDQGNHFQGGYPADDHL